MEPNNEEVLKTLKGLLWLYEQDVAKKHVHPIMRWQIEDEARTFVNLYNKEIK